MNELKACRTCLREKPLSEYYKDGRYPICKPCKKEETRKRYDGQIRNLTPHEKHVRMITKGRLYGSK